MEQINRRNREPYWKEKVNEFNQSGQTQKEFCQQHELSYWSFNSWKRRIESQPGETGLVEVTARIPAQLDSAEPIEIILSNNVRIKIPDQFKGETLRRIIEALGAGK